MFNLTAAQKIAWTLLGTLSLAAYACGDDDVIVRPPTTSTTTASGGAGCNR